MKEEIKLIVVLAQKSRHVVEICGMKISRGRLCYAYRYVITLCDVN